MASENRMSFSISRYHLSAAEGPGACGVSVGFGIINTIATTYCAIASKLLLCPVPYKHSLIPSSDGGAVITPSYRQVVKSIPHSTHGHR